MTHGLFSVDRADVSRGGCGLDTDKQGDIKAFTDKLEAESDELYRNKSRSKTTR